MHGRVDVHDEGGHLVDAGRRQLVLPRDGAARHRAHRGHVVAEEPSLVIGRRRDLEHAGQVDGVAVVEEEELVVDAAVAEVASDQ